MVLIHTHTHTCFLKFVMNNLKQKLPQRTVAHNAGKLREMQMHLHISLATGGQPMSAPSRSQRHIHEKADGRRQGVKPIRAKARPLKNCRSPSSEADLKINQKLARDKWKLVYSSAPSFSYAKTLKTLSVCFANLPGMAC